MLTRRVEVGQRRSDLTGREFALLEMFMRHPDQVLSREQLLAHVWGYDQEPGTNVVNVYVSALRRKVGNDMIESVRGVGYRFRAQHERNRDSIPQEMVSLASVPDHVHPAEHLGPVRVLVVEDDPRISAMIAKGLRAKGYEVECVATGLGVAERVARGDIDIELLDLGLPDIDGLQVLQRQRDSGNEVPVIVITARSDPRDRSDALALGAYDYVMKPFAWKSLWQVIESCLNVRREHSTAPRTP